MTEEASKVSALCEQLAHMRTAAPNYANTTVTFASPPLPQSDAPHRPDHHASATPSSATPVSQQTLDQYRSAFVIDATPRTLPSMSTPEASPAHKRTDQRGTPTRQPPHL